MSAPFVPRVGGILSADIAVPEHEREVHFWVSLVLPLLNAVMYYGSMLYGFLPKVQKIAVPKNLRLH